MKILKYLLTIIIIIFITKFILRQKEASQNEKNILVVNIGDSFDKVKLKMRNEPIITKLSTINDKDDFCLIYENGFAASSDIVIYFSKKDSTVTTIFLGD